MIRDLEFLKAALSRAPSAAWKGRVARRVEFLALTTCNPPNWLHTSGRPNRFNPRGIHCIYFAGDPDVARLEFECMWQGATAGGQPATDYNADVNLERMLDLTSPETLKTLGVKPVDLHANWRLAKQPTVTQLIGQAVCETKLFSAIRYPSFAAAKSRRPGVNVVLFPECLRAPEFVRIVGPANEPLQRLP